MMKFLRARKFRLFMRNFKPEFTASDKFINFCPLGKKGKFANLAQIEVKFATMAQIYFRRQK